MRVVLAWSCLFCSIPVLSPAGLAFASTLGGPFAARYCITVAAQGAAAAAAAASTLRARRAVERVGARNGSVPEA